MNLYLLRHGEAEPIASIPEGRQLTEAGILEVSSVARQFASSRYSLDVCFVRLALRAQQTAKIFLSHIFDSPDPSTIEELSANQRAAQLMKYLERVDVENILLVSHNPILSELLALLTRGNVEDMTILDTGELACVTLDIIGLGMGTCRTILRPNASVSIS